MKFLKILPAILFLYITAASCTSYHAAELPLEVQSEHFKFQYSSYDEKAIPDLQEALEENYERVTTNLKQTLDEPVQIKIYSDTKSLHKAAETELGWNNPPDWLVGAANKDTSGNVVILLLSPLNPPEDMTYSDMIKVAVHEFVHIVQYKMCPKFVPILSEGIACYEAEHDRRIFVESDLPNSIEEMFSWTLEDGEKLYFCGLSFVSFIVENYGYDKFIELYKKDYNGDFDDETKEIYKNWIAQVKEDFRKSDEDKIKEYICSLGEMQGNKTKLTSDDDPEAQLILAKYFLDKDVRKFYLPARNFGSAKDILKYYGMNESGEKIAKSPVAAGFKTFIISSENNRPVGKCTVHYLETLGCINIGSWIAKPFWGNGYAGDHLKAILKNFYDNKITVPVQLTTELTNTKALQVFEKLIKELDVKNSAAPRYHPERKLITTEETFKIDQRNPDFVICNSSGINHIKPKQFFDPELIEKGRREVKLVQFLLTPVYEK